MRVANKYSAGIRNEIPTPEEVYKGKRPQLVNKPLLQKAYSPKPWENEEGRGPYLDIMTFKSSAQPGEISEAADQKHTRLLIEPVLIPDLSHTGVSLSLTTEDKPNLFYPNGKKNNALKMAVESVIRAPSNQGSSHQLLMSKSQPTLSSTLGMAHQRLTVSAQGLGSPWVAASTPNTSQKGRSGVDETGPQRKNPSAGGFSRYDSEISEEDNTAYASHHRLSTHFSGDPPLSKQEAEILRAGLTGSAEGLNVKKMKSKKLIEGDKKAKSRSGEIVHAKVQRQRANQETQKVLAQLRKSTVWLQSLV